MRLTPVPPAEPHAPRKESQRSLAEEEIPDLLARLTTSIARIKARIAARATPGRWRGEASRPLPLALEAVPATARAR